MLGTRVRALRKQRNLSQTELAEAAGIKQHTLSRLETGLHKGVRTQALQSLAHALGVSVDELLGVGRPTRRAVP